MVAPIVSDADAYATKVLEALKRAGLRAEADLRNEKINYKVREHSVAKVPVMFVVGKREAEEGTVSVRRLGSQAQQVLSLDAPSRQSRPEQCPRIWQNPRRAGRRVPVRAAEAHADIGRSRDAGTARRSQLRMAVAEVAAR